MAYEISLSGLEQSECFRELLKGAFSCLLASLGCWPVSSTGAFLCFFGGS